MQSGVVEHFDKPDKLFFAFTLYEHTEDAWLSGVRKVDVALKADHWLNATTTGERDSIASRYFGEMKLTLVGDTLMLEDYGVIITTGKSIRDAGTTWQLYSEADDLPFIVSIANEDGILQTTGKCIGFYYNKINYSLHFQPKENAYEVTGTGTSYDSSYGWVSYSIKDHLQVKYADRIPVDQTIWHSNGLIQSGTVELLWSETHENSNAIPIHVDYLNAFRVEITAFDEKGTFATF